ncbi:uncharacterized protein LOC108676604 [Hyalella azteca]|uniref:Uncharacterized protein LOC108676604 n=1 Tax=Hyalella azteca TaxID=294128 RepID=A0A8B7P2F7_HYAAZ|nr:uncharacterized protein LOC108676604 [Hyalella azteca]
MYKTLLQLALEKCKHRNECCCKKMFKESFLEEHDEEQNVSQIKNEKFDDSSFVPQYDCKKGTNTWRGHHVVGESWFDGISSADTRSKIAAKKTHLEIPQLINAIKFCEHEDAQQLKHGRPTSDESQNATKNSMIAGIFMTTYSLPFVIYTALCTLLSIICPSHLSHPLGNQHQTYFTLQNITLANYEVCATTMKNFFATTFSATRSTRKFMICYGRGTIPMDASRQSTVATYVADNGLPKEVLLDVSMVRHGNMLSTMNHLKKIVASFLDPSSIAFICTDEAAVSSGTNQGLMELLRATDKYNNLLELPDFYHNLENLLNETMPQWVIDTLSTCRAIGSFMNNHNVMKQIHRHINVSLGSTFTVSLNQSQSQSAENVQLHLESILNNIQILFEALPELIHYKNSIGNRAKLILRLLANDSFVVRMMMIHRLYRTMLSKQKSAQDISFGPLEYKHKVDSLSTELCKLKEPSIEIQTFMKSGVIVLNSGSYTSYNYKGIKFKEISSNLGLETTNKLDRSRDDDMTSLIEENSKWIDNICKEACNHLEIPAPIIYASESFSLHCKSFMISKQLTAIKKLYDSVNIQFESCGSACAGHQECTCLKNDYTNFMDVFQSEWQAAPDNKLLNNETKRSQSYTQAFAHYISTNNRETTYPVNIIRCLEVVQLMKPTLSPARRVMSHVAITLRNRFESKDYLNEAKCDEDTLIDTVQMEVFLRCNTNMVQHDADLAKEIFLSKHEESLMKTEKSTDEGTEISNNLIKLGSEVGTKNVHKRPCIHDSEETDIKKIRVNCLTSEHEEAEQSLPQVSDGEVKSEVLEAGALLPVHEVFVVDKIKEELEDVDIKEEPFYDEKVGIKAVREKFEEIISQS